MKHLGVQAVYAAMAWGLTASAGWAATTVFSNANTIFIEDGTNAPTPAMAYPSVINVQGLAGSVITKVTVTLFSLSHEFPDDINVLLVGPHGQKAMIMSNVGGDIREPATNVTLNLDDDAALGLPFQPPLVSGTFKPTKRLAILTFPFPPPAPAGSESAPAPLAIFKGTEAEGQWKLFVVDDAYPDAGLFAGGWNLSITATPVELMIEAVGEQVVLSWTNAATGYVLQTAPTLDSSWTNAAPAPVQISGRYMVTNSVSGTSRFYRLRR